jgi:peptidoglycan/LPS O-acetylase OafA/YrhL
MPGLFTVLYIVLPVGNFCPGMLVYLASLDAAAGTWCARVRGVVARRPAPSLAVVIALWIVSQELPWLTNPVAFAVFDPLVGVASGLVLAVVLARPERVEPVARVLAPLGLVSFGIYLWHWVLLAVLLVNNGFPVHGFGAVPMVLHVVVLLGLTVPVAVVSWLVLERPLLRRTALWDRRGVRPAVEATAAGEAADGRALLARG